MDDLRRRFAGLDHVQAPDLWDQIESRAAARPSTVVNMAPVALTGSVQPRGFGAQSMALLVAAALLLAALVAGAVAVGSGVVHLTATDASIDPSAVPTASTAPTPTESAVPPATTAGLVAYTRSLDPATGKGTCPDGSRPTCLVDRIWIANADGTDARELLSDEPGNQTLMAWSPDGTRLLYQDETGAIALVDPSGTERQELGTFDTLCRPRCTNLDGFAFSPDGTRVAFAAGRSSDAGDSSVIAIIDLATGRATELSSTATTNLTEACDSGWDEGMDESPQWSPDGARIVFARQVMGPRDDDGYCHSALFSVPADGIGLQMIVAPDRYGLQPQWSPDGSRIAFHSADMLPATDGDGLPTLTDVFTVLPDGNGLQALTTDANSSWPSWTRDGRIVFVRWVDQAAGTYDHWIMDADGGRAARLPVESLADLSAVGCTRCPFPVVAGVTEAIWQPTP